MFKLVICDDEGKTTIVPFLRDEVSIGRQEGSTIRLTDRNVSRNHAKIFREGEDSFFIVDLASSNSTKVEGKIVSSEPVPVNPGDQVYVGDYKLSIRANVAATVPMGEQMNPGDNAGIGKVTPHARLVMLEGPEPGKEIDLLANLYVIGRSDEANLNIEAPSISRAHARMDGEDHQWTISDLDSINGITVNGNKRDDYVLKGGDVIGLGKVTLRFVASGEPFDYDSDGDDFAEVPQKASGGNLMYVLGAIAILATLVILVIVLLSKGETQEISDGDQAGETMSFDELVAAGADKMANQEWEEAAKYFAEAQRQNSDSIRARELKQKANMEMESQVALSVVVKAKNESDWQLALDEVVKIPKDSYYYDLRMRKKMAAKLCDELLYKADFMVTSDDPKAEELLNRIGGIVDVSDACLEQRDSLLKTIKEKAAENEKE